MSKYSNPYDVIHSKSNVTGTLNTAEDATVIAAPGAGKEIFIKEIQLQSEVATANVITLKKGTVAMRRVKLITDGMLVNIQYKDDEGINVGNNVAFVINLSAATAMNYYIQYEIRDVE